MAVVFFIWFYFKTLYPRQPIHPRTPVTDFNIFIDSAENDIFIHPLKYPRNNNKLSIWLSTLTKKNVEKPKEMDDTQNIQVEFHWFVSLRRVYI